MAIAFPISFWVDGAPPVFNTLKFIPCPGGPGGLGDVYIDVVETPGATIVVATGNPDEAWCYNFSAGPGPNPPTEGITWVNHEEEECPDPCQVYQITSCDGAYTLHTTNSQVMNYQNGSFTIQGFTECWENNFTPPIDLSLPNSVLQITDVVLEEIYSENPGCDCCDEGLNENRWEYTLCEGYEAPPGVPLTVTIEIVNAGSTPPPQVIVVDQGGVDYCYSNPVANCEAITVPFTEWVGEPDCENCIATHPGAGLSVNWQIDAYNLTGGGWNGQVSYWGIQWAGGGGNLPIVGATATPNALWPGYPCNLCGPDLYEATALFWPGNGIFQGDPAFGTGPSSVGYILNPPGFAPTNIGTCALTTNGPWTAAVTSAGFVDGAGTALPMEVYIAPNPIPVYADPTPQVVIVFTQLP